MSYSADMSYIGIASKGTQRQMVEDEYCTIDGCLRKAVAVAGLCPTHKQRLVRTGMTGTESETDWVMDSAGSECGVCGRSVYEHNVGEFCQLLVKAS